MAVWSWPRLWLCLASALAAGLLWLGRGRERARAMVSSDRHRERVRIGLGSRRPPFARWGKRHTFFLVVSVVPLAGLAVFRPAQPDQTSLDQPKPAS